MSEGRTVGSVDRAARRADASSQAMTGPLARPYPSV